MYICICRGISDKQIEEAKKTTKSFNELCKSLGLGSECGSCLKEAMQYAEASNDEINQNQLNKNF